MSYTVPGLTRSKRCSIFSSGHVLLIFFSAGYPTDFYGNKIGWCAERMSKADKRGLNCWVEFLWLSASYNLLLTSGFLCLSRSLLEKTLFLLICRVPKSKSKFSSICGKKLRTSSSRFSWSCPVSCTQSSFLQGSSFGKNLKKVSNINDFIEICITRAFENTFFLSNPCRMCLS